MARWGEEDGGVEESTFLSAGLRVLCVLDLKTSPFEVEVPSAWDPLSRRGNCRERVA